MSTIIRQAELQDVSSITRFMRVFEEELNEIGANCLPVVTEEILVQEMFGEDCILYGLIAEMGQKAVGYLLY